MLQIGDSPECLKLQLVKGDDFYKIIEARNEDGDTYDASEFAFQWTISSPTSDLVVIDGIIDESEIEFSAPASSFSAIKYIGDYTHTLRETTTNTTICKGPFKLI